MGRRMVGKYSCVLAKVKVHLSACSRCYSVLAENLLGIPLTLENAVENSHKQECEIKQREESSGNAESFPTCAWHLRSSDIILTQDWI